MLNKYVVCKIIRANWKTINKTIIIVGGSVVNVQLKL